MSHEHSNRATDGVTVPKVVISIIAFLITVGVGSWGYLWSQNADTGEAQTNRLIEQQDKILDHMATQSTALTATTIQMGSVINNQEKQYKEQKESNERLREVEAGNAARDVQINAYWRQANETNAKLASQGEQMAAILTELKNHTHEPH